jgi:hypothetical protein
MSILSRLRKKESMAAEERKTDIWSKAAAAAQSQPEQAVVGESTTDSVPNGNAEPEADDDLKSGYLALEGVWGVALNITYLCGAWMAVVFNYSEWMQDLSIGCFINAIVYLLNRMFAH